MQTYRRTTTTDRYLEALVIAQYKQPVKLWPINYTLYITAIVMLALIIYSLGGN
jgi:hypothetical protein